MIKKICDGVTVQQKDNQLETRIKGSFTNKMYSCLSRFFKDEDRGKDVLFDLRETEYVTSDFMSLFIFTTQNYSNSMILAYANSEVHRILKTVGITEGYTVRLETKK